ncbi:prepilin-type N-terminal cleavage/methylation domain-containing protein [Methylophilus sp. 5]|uniref:prepilin-type N-terminal cleavage/methylation domain-containing protein n=1 Tax=Methylophilus sp. 5 TaxID=1112274 RepID=UPI00048ACAFE|nr:prepilin-type N-terminal cleavage/methylation domain-containing protein [Methylophilus sp. 5]
MTKTGNHNNNKHIPAGKKNHHGFSLVEMVVFIVIVTTAIAGVIGALAFMSGHSADPLARKQAIAIAESLMQEIQQMPFTFCDPDDPNASTANSAADCSTSQANLGGPSPAGESRYSATNPFDNVADYGGFTMPGGGCTGICRIGSSTALAGLNAYSASVAINQAGGAGAFAGLPAAAVLQIVVTVTGPANTTIRLTGFKVRYAPKI